MGRSCSFPGCDRRYRAAGYCSTHYKQQLRGEALRPVLAMGSWLTKDKPAVCSFSGCGRKRIYSELCYGHYWQQSKGYELTPIAPQRAPLAWLTEALAARGRDDGCWLDWPFAFSRSNRRLIDTGEGDFRRPHLAYKGKVVRAARLLLYLESGKWPQNALHRCDHPACLNPDHLYDGTQKDNMREMHARGRDRHHVEPAGIRP